MITNDKNGRSRTYTWQDPALLLRLPAKKAAVACLAT